MKKKTKICSHCKKVKKLNSFYTSKTQSSGLQSNCKDCNRYISKTFYQCSDKNKTKLDSRKTLLKCKYGLSLEDYDNLLLIQNGVCAICGCKETSISNKKGGVDSLRVDHCHTTGKVRGLLCSKCNFGIGNFKDSLQLLISATSYILKYKQFMHEEERVKKNK